MDRARSAVRPLIGATDERSTRDIGRRARLELRFAVRDGRTTLVHGYAEPPLRVGRSFQEGDGLHLILASSAPGIFGGDVFEQQVVVERGARVRLTSQSALQAHPSADRLPAVLNSRYVVDTGASLVCEWDPMIPFPSASLRQQIRLEVEKDALLFWSDAFMSGREARGERWQFAELSHELRLRRSGTDCYLERYRITPDSVPTRPWAAGDASYFGTMLAVRPRSDAGMAEEIHGTLAELAGIDAAAEALDDTLLLVRLMSGSGVAFHAARQRASQGILRRRD